MMLTRIEAAKFLGVSTRTIDRYVSSAKVSTERKNGKVMFRTKDLELFKSQKNPVVGQVITNPTTQKNTKNIQKYKILYEEAKQDVEKRDELIRNMHYRLGSLEAEKKNMIPQLEAQNKKKEIEEVVEKISEENIQLSAQLKKAKYGRAFFFLLAFLFLGILALSWVVGNSEI